MPLVYRSCGSEKMLRPTFGDPLGAVESRYSLGTMSPEGGDGQRAPAWRVLLENTPARDHIGLSR